MEGSAVIVEGNCIEGECMYCSNCGKQIQDDARFCIYCGHGVSESEAEGQNVRGGDEPRNYAAFEKTQGAGNYYRPYPIAVEDMAVPEKIRKKNLLPIVILVAVIVSLIRLLNIYVHKPILFSSTQIYSFFPLEIVFRSCSLGNNPTIYFFFETVYKEQI